MNKNSLTTAVIAGIAGVAGIANMASAVNLNPDGLGQVLLYPYYTVNGGQQTVLSVVNTTNVGKAVKVRFLEGYNSREVLDFNLFLSRFDVWTASVFSLSDGGQSGTGAAIFTNDNSCTAPIFNQGPLGNGFRYQQFLNYAYNGTYEDTGPTTDDRTREGHFEIISMADIVPGSDLDVDITHVNGVPPDCGTASQLGQTTAEKAFEAAVIGTDIVPPLSGLFGAAGVVNATSGTYFSYNADAIDGFTAKVLRSTTGSLAPSLGDVNDPGAANATSYVFDDGQLIVSTYPQGPSGIDAVSSIFMASNLFNEYQISASVGTDWVVTFPTKRFYVDPLYNKTASAFPPFFELFGENTDGLSCTEIGITTYDREEKTLETTGCGFSPCPPGQPPSSLCHETNVVTFNQSGTTSVLASTLTSNIAPVGGSGWSGLNLDPADQTHVLTASDPEGNVFHGLPVTGFSATRFVRSVSGGINYGGVNRHRESRNCTNGTAGCS